MTPSPATRWIVLRPLVATPAAAPGHPFFTTHQSLERSVLNSDVLVVGKIATVQHAAKLVNGNAAVEVTIAVDETLRGEHAAKQKSAAFIDWWNITQKK